ncbi:hypothetical protein [Glaciihabitans sp. dw_435]|uniref:hypothetical protein n=1 Tax=Glaciihabitans sp. dw_435 TaxID=2720081 RepID=UPI001BD3F4F7|nr:hypothetical protein [Glaciihabitans sp. dw_435]
MAFFRRRRAKNPTAAIAAFWTWWRESGAAAFEKGAATNEWGAAAEEMSRRVDAINPSLSWELAGGFDAELALVVTGAGSRELRPITDQWLRAAPPATEIWEYIDYRRRSDLNEGFPVMYEDVLVEFSDARFVMDIAPDYSFVDVDVYHPAFALLTGVEGPGGATFLILDALVGERDVEEFIGGVDVMHGSAPAGAVDGAALLAAIDAIKAKRDSLR